MNSVFQSNRTEVYYKPESSPGLVKSGSDWKRLRVTGESLSESKTMKARRVMDGTKSITRIDFNTDGAAGTLTCNLNWDNLDDIFACVMQNNWMQNSLRQGDTFRTVSILVVNQSSTGATQTLHTGCAFSSVNFQFQVNSVVAFTFDVVGLNTNHNLKTLEKVGTQEVVFTDFFIGMDATLTSSTGDIGYVTSFSGSFGFGVEVVKCADRQRPRKLRLGGFDSLVTVTGALSTMTNVNTFQEERSFKLQLNIAYKEYSYKFLFPKLYMTSYIAPSQGEGAIVATATMQAVYEQTSGSSIVLQRLQVKEVHHA